MEGILGTEVVAPCGHHYDLPCVLELFAAATRDETLFPPRCCNQPIPLDMVLEFMTASDLQAYLEKATEFGTPRRVYCAKPACSRFLGAQFEATTSGASSTASFLTCPAVGCGTTTCSGCKNEVKPSTPHSCAASDTDLDAEILELAKFFGWARCPGCGALIEHNQGCYHMTCLCKVQFCYRCGARWRTCSCNQWDDQQLFHTAEARADGDNVNDVVELLREDPGCVHDVRVRRDGGGRCDQCNRDLSRYHFVSCTLIPSTLKSLKFESKCLLALR